MKSFKKAVNTTDCCFAIIRSNVRLTQIFKTRYLLLSKITSLRTSMRFLLPLSLSTMLLGCTNQPLSLSTNPNDVMFEDLVKIENSKMDLSFAKPGVDWHKFTSVHIAKISANNDHPDNYKAPKIDKKWDGYNATYDIPDEGLRKLESEFITMAKNVFNNEQPWQYSDTIDQNTLVVHIEITDIRLAAPIETSRRNQNINGKTYTQNAGSMVLKAALVDGGTNEIIATSIDRAAAHDNWRLNTQVFNWSDVRTIYRSWSNALKNALFQAQQETTK